jgi:hypothetical protein
LLYRLSTPFWEFLKYFIRRRLAGDEPFYSLLGVSDGIIVASNGNAVKVFDFLLPFGSFWFVCYLRFS